MRRIDRALTRVFRSHRASPYVRLFLGGTHQYVGTSLPLMPPEHSAAWVLSGLRWRRT